MQSSPDGLTGSVDYSTASDSDINQAFIAILTSERANFEAINPTPEDLVRLMPHAGALCRGLAASRNIEDTEIIHELLSLLRYKVSLERMVGRFGKGANQADPSSLISCTRSYVPEKLLFLCERNDAADQRLVNGIREELVIEISPSDIAIIYSKLYAKMHEMNLRGGQSFSHIPPARFFGNRADAVERLIEEAERSFALKQDRAEISAALK